MLLSIGMMVKNEEKHLEECLNSLLPLLEQLDSELIIIDTGSEDKTIEIARKYTKNLYFHRWNDDFSQMRNLTIKYSIGEWFFCIDGDEVLENSEGIIEFFKSGEYKNYNSASMEIKNYTSNLNKNNFGICDTIRFFRNDGTFKYKGTVHNQPEYKEPTKKIKCMLEHYGYISDDDELMEKKFQRTSSILKKELENDPDNIYYLYQLAVSYSMHNDSEEALEKISKAYDKLTYDIKKNYKYIYSEYANILIANKKFRKCIELCENELKLTEYDEVYKIDLFYFLAKCKLVFNDYEEAIENYNKYFDILKKWEEGKLPIDLANKILTLSCKDTAYNDIAIVEYNNKNYKSVIENIDKIENEENLRSLMNMYINSFLKLENNELLKDIYCKKILQKELKTIHEFERQLENIKMRLEDKKIIMKLETWFADLDLNNPYIYLNKIRIFRSDEEKNKYIKLLLDKFDLNKEGEYFGDLIYMSIKSNYNVLNVLSKLDSEKVYELLIFCYRKYKDFSDDLYKTILSLKLSEVTLRSCLIINTFCKSILIINKISKCKYGEIFDNYISTGVRIVKYIYNNEILEQDFKYMINDKEHKFFIIMHRANKIKEVDTENYIKLLKEALREVPELNTGIKIYLDKFTESINSVNLEMRKLKQQFINNIKYLMSYNKIDEAMEMINQYEEMLGLDFEILYLKSEILVLE